MHVRVEKGAAWLGLGMAVWFGVVFWIIAGFIPPWNPADSAEVVAKHYADDQLRIRIAMTLVLLTGALFAPFFASLARQVRRIEGYWGVLSVSQIMLSVTFPFGLLICCMAAVTAAYRPERDPQITQALNDVFWFIFVGMVGPLLLQVVILAIAVFIDERPVPSFPRWFGYFNIFYAVFEAPGGAIYLFNGGPLAWNGMFAFWVPLGVIGIWWIVLAIMLLKAIDVEADERAAAAAVRAWEPAA